MQGSITTPEGLPAGLLLNNKLNVQSELSAGLMRLTVADIAYGVGECLKASANWKLGPGDGEAVV
jgi:hypothetical protein